MSIFAIFRSIKFYKTSMSSFSIVMVFNILQRHNIEIEIKPE